MKQRLVYKEVILEKPKTLKTILEEEMVLKGLELTLIDKVRNHLIFAVDGVMERNLNTVLKIGQTVRLIPAVKAG